MNAKTWNVLLIIGFFVFLILGVIQSCKINELNKTIDLQSVEILIKNDSVKAYRTKADSTYYKLNTATIEANALKGSLKLLGIENKDLKEKGIKLRDVVSVLKAKLEMNGTDTIILHDTTYVDTDGSVLKEKKYNWTNKYLTLSGVIKEKFMVTDYSYQSGMTFIANRDKNKTNITATLTDPKARLTTGYFITVKDKGTRWYSKWWVWGLAGVAGGIYIAK